MSFNFVQAVLIANSRRPLNSFPDYWRYVVLSLSLMLGIMNTYTAPPTTFSLNLENGRAVITAAFSISGGACLC